MNDARDDVFDGDIPGEVEELLYSIHLPPEFDRRCDQAGPAAYVIDRIRGEMGAHKLSPIPFGRFVSALAEMAKVSLDAVLSAFDIPEIDAVNGKTARGFARLARLLGLTSQSAQILLAMGFQAATDREAANALMAAYRGARQVPIETGLREWEDHSPDEVRAELERIRRAIDSEYEQMG